MSISNPTCTFAGLSKPEPVEPHPTGTQNYTRVPPSNARGQHQAGQMNESLPVLANLLASVINDRQAARKPCDFLTGMKEYLCAVAKAKKILDEYSKPELASNRVELEAMVKETGPAELLQRCNSEPAYTKSVSQVLARYDVKLYACKLRESNWDTSSFETLSALATSISQKEDLPSPEEALAFALCLFLPPERPDIKFWARRSISLLVHGEANPTTQ